MRMKGSVGTAMMFPGERSRVLPRRTIKNLQLAREILKVRKLVDEQAVEVCEWALKYPLGLTHRQAGLIFAVWIKLAKAGHLRGLRKPK